MHNPIDRIAYTTAYTIRGATSLEQKIAQRVHHEGSIRRPIAHNVNNEINVKNATNTEAIIAKQKVLYLNIEIII